MEEVVAACCGEANGKGVCEIPVGTRRSRIVVANAIC